ncbi:hypothetical protein RM704_38140 [Streptomyces sp. DSM 3412]|uniref:Uncharacterized protein n=1 Tax=Streptomyces gottesmaniae TaxID=3075518 RepID=A0ABU2ZA90_9ACTN|nr:hypothetical protein [Streptomyces sp. DSM 3412]MDT0573214.1 hypothetical protein [Streptomyces sp. DSM 3412]
MSGDTPRTGTGAAPLPQGLPRRARNAPSTPRLGENTADAPSTADGDDTADTLRPDALARVMVAIQQGSTRARLAEPDGDVDGTPGTDGPPAPRPGPEAA